MPVSVALSFPAGRFHATPWGHHVNEALPEWPPSPWRLLRALVAVWKRKLPHLPREAVGGVLAALAEAPPAFHLPPATLGHTRHYMPKFHNPETDRVKVFDAFVAVAPGAEVVFHWPDARLDDAARQALADLLAKLGYFGRAESWCAARLLDDFNPDADLPAGVNCSTDQNSLTRRLEARRLTTRLESVRVLTASTGDETTTKDERLSWNGWAFTDKKVVTPDPRWNLLAETADLHLERWSDPPGSRWVTYYRPADCFTPRPARRPTPHGDAKTEYVVARFVLDVADGRRPLPLVTDTLPLAEAVRSALIGLHYRASGRHSPIFTGKDENGEPRKDHDHAFYLPTDENGDGRVDHVTVYARGKFSRDDVSALDRLRSLRFGEDRGQGPTHRLLLVGLDRQPPDGWGPFGPARDWVSATPYIAYRHLKERGRKRDDRAFLPPEALPAFLEQVFRDDWERRAAGGGWPGLTGVTCVKNPLADPREPNDPGLGWRYRSLQFRRGRDRPGDDGYSRPFGALRLTFDREVSGPLSLGYACHFGMGAFRRRS